MKGEREKGQKEKRGQKESKRETKRERERELVSWMTQ